MEETIEELKEKIYKNIDILREAGLKKKIIAEKVGYSSRQGLEYAIKHLKFRDNILELNQKLEDLINKYYSLSNLINKEEK